MSGLRQLHHCNFADAFLYNTTISLDRDAVRGALSNDEKLLGLMKSIQTIDSARSEPRRIKRALCTQILDGIKARGPRNLPDAVKALLKNTDFIDIVPEVHMADWDWSGGSATDPCPASLTKPDLGEPEPNPETRITDYEILGVPKGASKRQIERAYAEGYGIRGKTVNGRKIDGEIWDAAYRRLMAN